MCTLPHLDLDLPATLPCALHPAVALTSDQTWPDKGGCEHSAGSLPPALPGGREETTGGAGHAGGGLEGRAGGQVWQGSQECQGKEQWKEEEVDWKYPRHCVNPILLQSRMQENASCVVGWLVSSSSQEAVLKPSSGVPITLRYSSESPLNDSWVFSRRWSELLLNWRKAAWKLVRRIAFYGTCLVPYVGEGLRCRQLFRCSLGTRSKEQTTHLHFLNDFLLLTIRESCAKIFSWWWEFFSLPLLFQWYSHQNPSKLYMERNHFYKLLCTVGAWS